MIFNDLEPRMGEAGITRTDRTDVPLWRLRVHFTTGIQPCIETRRAASAEEALRFVLNSYSYADPARTVVLGRADNPTITSQPMIEQLQPCEKDRKGRAILTDAILQTVWDLHEAGTPWGQMAERLGCNVDHMRKSAAALIRTGNKRREAVPAFTPLGDAVPALAWSSDLGLIVTVAHPDRLRRAGVTHYLPLPVLSSGAVT